MLRDDLSTVLPVGDVGVRQFAPVTTRRICCFIVIRWHCHLEVSVRVVKIVVLQREVKSTDQPDCFHVFLTACCSLCIVYENVVFDFTASADTLRCSIDQNRPQASVILEDISVDLQTKNNCS